MAISDKLTYLNTTKSQLKDMINYGLPTEEQITSSTTFRNYVSSIFNAFLEALRTPDTLFTNLPKITGSGSNITLNGTANAPMRIELSPSELTQDGTPTPDSPQDIHTISGSNTIKVNGKNLWSVGDIANVGWATSNNDFKDLLNSLEAGTYTLTLNYKVTNINLVSNTNICGFYIANSNSSISKRKTETSLTVDEIVSYVNTISITSAMVGKFTAVYFYGFGNDSNGKTATSNIINNQLELGTTATTYEPYISQEAEVDLGYENLLNPEDVVKNTTSGITLTPSYDENGNLEFINVNGTSTGAISYYYINDNITLPAGTYYLSDGVGSSGGENNDTFFLYTSLGTGQNSYTNNGVFTLSQSTTGHIRFVIPLLITNLICPVVL